MFKEIGKKKLLMIAIIGLFIFMGTACNLVQMNPEAAKKQVVAKIGEEEVLKQEFNYYLTIEKLNWKLQGQDFPGDEETLKQIKGQILDVIVENQLLLQAAKAEEVEIEDKEINTQVEDTIKSLMEDIGGEEEYNKFLEENDITPDEFKEFLKGYFLDNQYIVGLYQKITEDIEVKDQDVEKYYEDNIKQFDPSTVEAKHILSTSQEQAEEIRDKAKEGEDFEALMEEYKEKEGIQEAADLGEFTYTKMVPEFSEAAFALEPGDVSDIVQTSYGFHVIKVVNKTEKEVQKLEEVKDTIQAQLKSTAEQEAFYNYYTKRQEETDIKTYPEKL